MAKGQIEELDWEVPPSEPDRPSILGVFIGLVVVLALFACSLVVTYLYLLRRVNELHPHPEVPYAPLALRKATLNVVNQDLFTLDTRGYQLAQFERERLESYGWVDRSRGVIHVPIGVAMEKALAEGAR